MKTSRAQQEKTRAQIIRSSVDLMSRNGFDGVTMKEVARAAGIGDATIYKYFPTKERLLLGYFDLVVEEAIAAALETPGFDDYDLQAKLQRLTDAILERLLPDREFAVIAHALFAKSPLLLLGDQLKAKQLLKDAALRLFDDAVNADELPPSDFLRLMSGVYVDYCIGVISYWLADKTPEFADTTRLVDQTLGILVLLLKSGLPDRLVELGSFVFRSQLARWLPSTDLATAPPRTKRPRATSSASAARKARRSK